MAKRAVPAALRENMERMKKGLPLKKSGRSGPAAGGPARAAPKK